MKPISGDTVLSIIHGPATTGHFVEMSKFVNHEIDVWVKDRVLVIGSSSSARQPHPRRLNVGHRSSAGRAGGHFTLNGGLEPRNPDAGCHPDNCGFDVVSDQTGYPASLLRRIIVQRMLVRLYQSRLRGRDHRFQCSRCSISGGARIYDYESAKSLVKSSMKYEAVAHSNYHVFKLDESRCSCPVIVHSLSEVCCLRGYTRYHSGSSPKTGFLSVRDMIDILVRVLNSPQGQEAQDYCMDEPTYTVENMKPDPVRIFKNVLGMERRGVMYWIVAGGGQQLEFDIENVLVIIDVIDGRRTAYFYDFILKTIYPLR